MKDSKNTSLYPELTKNIEHIKREFGDSDDLQIRAVHVGKDPSTPCALIYIDGAAKTRDINELVDSLVVRTKDISTPSDAIWEDLSQIAGTINPVHSFEELNVSVLAGKTVFLVDEHLTGYAISTEGWETRGIQESGTESVIRGPRESFTENFRINTSLIRRRVKDPNLRVKEMSLGRVTQTRVSLVYINGIVNKKALEEIEDRLSKIDIDGVLESGYLEEFLQDKKWSFFPVVYSTERPDVTAAGILEGRIAIIVDGTPFVMLAPVLFVQFFQAAEDYYLPAIYSLIARFIRYFSFFVLLFATSLFIAANNFHQELFPIQLLISLAVQRENIPFPIVTEALFLMLAFEILRESIIRMPKAVGSAVSIVGGLVLGDAAISAGLVSNALVIVIAIEAVASFILPTAISTPVRLIRFGMVVLAAFYGLVGIFVGGMLLLIHLCTIKSFGIPYMSPLTPIHFRDQKDTFLRFPVQLMRTRPSLIEVDNPVRQGKGEEE